MLLTFMLPKGNKAYWIQMQRWLATPATNIDDLRQAAKCCKKPQQDIEAKSETEKIPLGWDDALPFEAIPGPKPLPIFGNFLRFTPPFGEYAKMSAHLIIKSLHEKYGNVILIKGIGRPTSVLLKDPEDFEKVFRNESQRPIRNTLASLTYYRTVHRKDLFKGFPGLGSMHGDEWFKSRSIVNQILMKPRVVAAKVPEIDYVTQDLIRNITMLMKKQKGGIMADNFIVELQKWALESMGVLALDTRFGCLDLNASKDSSGYKTMQKVTECFDLLVKLDIKPSLWRYISTPNWIRFVKLLDELTSDHLEHVDKAMVGIKSTSKPENKQSALERLIKLDRDVALVTSLDMMLGGVDTTSYTLASALYLLAKNPAVQQKLYEECVNILPNKQSSLTPELLELCSYLKAVVKETLRVYPTGSANLRTVEKDLVLGGFQIPKGTEVVIDFRNACHDEKNFKNPWQFIPERWVRSNKSEMSHKNAHPFSFLPFGYGPRTCIGKRMAMMEIEIAVAKIVRNFRISWPHKEEPQFEQKIFFGISSPLKLQFEKN